MSMSNLTENIEKPRISQRRGGVNVKELFQMRLLVYSMGLLLSSALERIITSLINTQFNLFENSPLLYHFLSVFILVVMFIFTNVFLQSFINRKWVSKKVFGNNFVGGYWFEIVFEETHGKDEISHYCFLEIGYDIDKIYLSGTDYDKDFKFMYNLETESASMKNHCLSYLFTCADGAQSWRGYGNIVFHKTVDTKFNRYTGRYKDDDNKKFRVEGYLIDSKDDIRSLKKELLPAFQEIIDKRKIVIAKQTEEREQSIVRIESEN